MNAPPSEPRALWPLARAACGADQVLADASGRIGVAALDRSSLLGPALASLEGASVLIWSRRQLPAARAILELDGVVRRMLLCPPDIDPAHLPAILAEAEVDAVVAAEAPDWLPERVRWVPLLEREAAAVPRRRASEWVLFTSGTTGRPKLVSHTLASLAGPLAEGPVGAAGTCWSTFYDIRRYGGLQILLRAMIGGVSLILSQEGEAVGDFLTRAGAEGVTHLLGTPTHWRRALMSPALAQIAPRYVRLSGEIADQAVLDQLARTFPAAAITHAYASTEAGVGFEVNDRREGFPPSVLGRRDDGREIRIIDGLIRMRSPRAAARYLGGETLVDGDGFIDTGDMVSERDGRYHFAGRRSGVINVGGQKVHPEEVETVIMRHPSVRLARVRGRKSPITGTLVIADVALQPGAPPFATLRDEILAGCRAALPPHKVPAMLHEVADLAVGAAGKLERKDA